MGAVCSFLFTLTSGLLLSGDDDDDDDGSFFGNQDAVTADDASPQPEREQLSTDQVHSFCPLLQTLILFLF